MSRSNRKAYVLVATGNHAVVDGRWRSFGRDAFLTSEDAEAALPEFLERCRAAESEVLGPDPSSLSARVMPLAFADDLDAPGGEAFLLTAEGRDALLEDRLPFVCGTLFASRDRAEAEMPAFLGRCSDPELGLRYSLREDLKGNISRLALQPSAPEAAPTVPGPRP